MYLCLYATLEFSFKTLDLILNSPEQRDQDRPRGNVIFEFLEQNTVLRLKLLGLVIHLCFPSVQQCMSHMFEVLILTI